jgi:hypothetical protein
VWQQPRPAWQDQPQEPPQTAASGLPVRTPRQPTPAPLSPSGSLWDPVDRDPAPESGGPGNPGQLHYGWDRQGQEQTESFPTLSPELRQELFDWGVPE